MTERAVTMGWGILVSMRNGLLVVALLVGGTASAIGAGQMPGITQTGITQES